MSATRMDLHGYVEALRETVPHSIDPAAKLTIESWLAEMNTAADIGDEHTAARLAWMIAEKVELELERQRHHRD
ncbi:MAG: hypothetical protein WA702_27165 [Bradyrhizobium sp.]|jgi:hypothetical protein|uniref:hypothetical protein n=1 Tax=Bradyrhizobium sp. TaxID=376 RepID=UPI003C798955